MVAKSLAVGALAVGMLISAMDYCDAGRGGGRGGGGGGGRGGGGGHFGGGGGFSGGAHINNGFHHRPSGGGNYHRPGGGFGGGAHVDNTLPRPGGDHRPGGGGDHDRPGDGGDHNRPGGGQGGDGNDYYFGWDNPSYGLGVATGLAIGTYVYSVPANCVYQEYSGLTYRRCGDIWYQPQYEDFGIRYVVVNRPF